MRILYVLLSLSLVIARPAIAAGQEVPDEDPVRIGREAAKGHVDPETHEYYPDTDVGNRKWADKEAERLQEVVDASKSGMTVRAYRDFKRRLEDEFREEERLDKLEPRSRAVIKSLKLSAEFAIQEPGGVSTLVWSADNHGSYSVRIEGGGSHKSAVINLGDAEDLNPLNRFISDHGVTLLEGRFPDTKSWHRWLRTTCKRCVLSSRHSSNHTTSEKVFAALLGTVVVNPAGIKAYTALPYEKGFLDSAQERKRMRISGSKNDWLAVNEQISASLKSVAEIPDDLRQTDKLLETYNYLLKSPGELGARDPKKWKQGVMADIEDYETGKPPLGPIPLTVAEKDPLLQEFREGGSDVLIIIAHSDGTKIYLPGKNGATISIEELRATKREQAPARIVILIACGTGGVNNNTTSIAEVLLANNLARSVFAYPGSVSVSVASEMLRKLRAPKAPRNAFSGLYQIVEIPRSAQ